MKRWQQERTQDMDALPEDSDYGEFQDKPKVTSADLRKKALELVAAEVDLAKAKKVYEEAEEIYKRISEKELPEIFDELGIDHHNVGTDVTLKLDEITISSPLKENYDKVMNWLEDNSNGGLIKRLFTIAFDKADEKWAAKFARDLGQRKKPLNAKIERKVHPQTLSAFARTRLEEGKALPDIFGIIKKKSVKIKVNK